ncbi:uncharacterized protein J3D65DRAFT_479072 [Phyllosticta citribraziliensis]|uniref:Uncharacterized protein n=1 Tax=Phyllosticta citribraziliensis TaxID=989973 RepID=A0ABR1LI31_9PEZI
MVAVASLTRPVLRRAPVLRLSTSSRCISTSNLRDTLFPHRLPPVYSDLTPSSSHALAITLSSFLPADWTLKSPVAALPRNNAGTPALPPPSPSLPLAPAHHLVYFNPALPAERLLPDGTDPLQSPGEQYPRRMWAGGHVRWGERPVPLDGKRWVCVEGIRDVTVKGREGEEKVFVGIERRIGQADGVVEGKEGSEEEVRQKLWTENEDDLGEAWVIERRNIVFMRGRSPEQAKTEVSKGGKVVKPPHAPDFSHTIVPTPSLLFRYSALTFNAHAIHLDPAYCRDVEGHRDLLFHGPLSFTFLATLLHNNIGPGKRIASLEYRNVAPLYCNEPIKFCGRKVEKGNGGLERYDVWAETPEGGLAVKGTAWTT